MTELRATGTLAPVLPFRWPVGFVHRESLRGPARIISFPATPSLHARLERPRGWAALRARWSRRLPAFRAKRPGQRSVG